MVNLRGHLADQDGRELVCPKCARTVQMREERWQAAYSQLLAVGITAVHICRVPF